MSKETTDVLVEEKEVTTEEVTEEKQPFQMTEEELAKATSGETQETTSAETTDKEDTQTVEKETKETKDTKETKETMETETDKGDTKIVSIEEFEKLQRKAEKNDKLLAKLGTELGMFRKASPEEEVEELQKIRDAYVQDPLKGMQLYDEYKERKVAEYREAQKQQVEELETNTRELIENVAPGFVDQMEEIAGLLKEDGYSDEVIKSFKANPYLYGADTLFQIHKRVGLQKDMAELKEENEKLKKENEELKTKPSKLLSEIEKETNRKKVTSKKGDETAAHADVPDKPAFLMTKEELAKNLSGG